MKVSVFGDRLKFLRKEKETLTGEKFTQEQLADIFNVEKGTVSNWENGNRFPSEAILIKLADFYKVTTDFLLGRTDQREDVQLTIDDFIKVAPEHKWVVEEEGLEYIALMEEIKDKEIPPEVIKETIELILKYRHLNKDSHD